MARATVNPTWVALGGKAVVACARGKSGPSTGCGDRAWKIARPAAAARLPEEDFPGPGLQPQIDRAALHHRTDFLPRGEPRRTRSSPRPSASAQSPGPAQSVARGAARTGCGRGRECIPGARFAVGENRGADPSHGALSFSSARRVIAIFIGSKPPLQLKERNECSPGLREALRGMPCQGSQWTEEECLDAAAPRRAPRRLDTLGGLGGSPGLRGRNPSESL